MAILKRVFLSLVLLGAGALTAASDRMLKSDIRSAKRSIKEFLSQLPKSPTAGFSLWEGT